ncbi:MAG TPA: hypothetical protein VK183_07250 [Flavobacterium sp.]|nr:hypothetical protein [Flavobacterium sp.]
MTKFGWLLLFVSQLLFSQEPAPYFKFSVEQLGGDTETFRAQYEVVTSLFREQIDSTAFGFSAMHTENQFRAATGREWLVFIVHRLADPPQKSNIVSICIRKKKTQQCMGLFIRVGQSLDSGEELKLDNLHFSPGNFFIDLCGNETRPYSVTATDAMRKSLKIDQINHMIRAVICP